MERERFISRCRRINSFTYSYIFIENLWHYEHIENIWPILMVITLCIFHINYTTFFG